MTKSSFKNKIKGKRKQKHQRSRSASSGHDGESTRSMKDKQTEMRRRKEHRKKPEQKHNEKIQSSYVDQELAVVHKQGYIALIGQWVERIAATAICNIPDHAIGNRKLRDGDAFHITISKAKETTSRMRQSSSLQQMNQLISNSPPPINLGVGMVKHENNSSRSWYCSISWAAGQQLRTMFELPPRDFHLTLGFDHKDVHVHKGPSTLLIHSCITTTQILSKEQIEGLRDAALIEAHTSQERSLISFALALAQAELIADPALVLSIKHSINGLTHMATVASSVHNSSSSSQ